MATRWLLFAGTFLLASTWSLHGRSEITTIALTGDTIPGAAGAQFASFSAGALNTNGQAAFHATLQQASGEIAQSIWKFNGTNISKIAQTGTPDVPQVPNANFQQFSSLGINDAGDVRLRAILENGVGGISPGNGRGLWDYSSTGSTQLLRIGSTIAAGVPNATFRDLQVAISMAENGWSVVTARLNSGGGGVTLDNDQGIWTYENGVGNLLVREGISPVPGVDGATFEGLGDPTINNQNSIALLGHLKDGNLVNDSTKRGIWKYDGINGSILARSGSGDVPGIAGSSFYRFGNPALNDQGQVAFHATIDVSPAEGMWLYTNQVGELLAQTGSGGVPGLAGANFLSFEPLLLSDSGKVLVHATLEEGPGGITSVNNNGLWQFDPAGNDSLLLQTGNEGVPGIAEASFTAIDTLSMNESGQVAVAADLTIGSGGVGSHNDRGIWLMDPTGSYTLVARKGDLLAGRTIADLQFLGGSGGSDGRPRGLNADGQLLFQATFTNGEEGLFLYSELSSGQPADFNTDGLVDGADLSWWESAFGSNSSADADGDGDTDGTDFLLWQRQQTGAVSIQAVPEPSPHLFLALIGAIFCCGSRVRYLPKSSLG